MLSKTIRLSLRFVYTAEKQAVCKGCVQKCKMIAKVVHWTTLPNAEQGLRSEVQNDRKRSALDYFT